jgi:hypothetical protein
MPQSTRTSWLPPPCPSTSAVAPSSPRGPHSRGGIHRLSAMRPMTNAFRARRGSHFIGGLELDESRSAGLRQSETELHGNFETKVTTRAADNFLNRENESRELHDFELCLFQICPSAVSSLRVRLIHLASSELNRALRWTSP